MSVLMHVVFASDETFFASSQSTDGIGVGAGGAGGAAAPPNA